MILACGLGSKKIIGDVLDGLQKNLHDNSETEKKVKNQVLDLCKKFPIYSKLI